MWRSIIAVGILTMVIGIGSAGYGVWTIWKQHRAITSAMPVAANVVGHETKELKASGFVAKVPLVKYTYMVNGQPYTCEAVTPAEFMLPDTWAQSVFQQFPIGAQVQAQYDPNDPSQAFLIAKYSVYPYLPLLVGLVIAALGLGIVSEQLTSHDAPQMTPTSSGAMALGAKQHHLAHARMLGIVGIIGLICGVPAIVHHVLVSTPPYERMGFLLEGAYVIAVLTVLVRSALKFRQASGFGTPVVTLNRAPTIGQPLQLKVAVPTRFQGTAHLNAVLKCETKDTRLFNFSEEQPSAPLLEQQLPLARSKSVSKGDEIAGAVEFMIPDHLPPSTPVDSGDRMHVVWNLVLTAEGSGGRKAETEYILPVANATLGHQDNAQAAAGASR
jgi:hypothetical protein